MYVILAKISQFPYPSSVVKKWNLLISFFFFRAVPILVGDVQGGSFNSVLVPHAIFLNLYSISFPKLLFSGWWGEKYFFFSGMVNRSSKMSCNLELGGRFKYPTPPHCCGEQSYSPTFPWLFWSKERGYTIQSYIFCMASMFDPSNPGLLGQIAHLTWIGQYQIATLNLEHGNPACLNVDEFLSYHSVLPQSELYLVHRLAWLFRFHAPAVSGEQCCQRAR